MQGLRLGADHMVFDQDLSPAQVRSIGDSTDLTIVDRTQLILDIFARRAQSRDGKLQVELAQLKYSLPRLNQRDDALSRLTGGIGGRGPGETKLEIGRRRARDRIHRLERELKGLEQQRRERRRQRERSEQPLVAIVGYTNAGKSTLLNGLTNAGVLAEDKLFATLDPRARRLTLQDGSHAILTDTVGFVRKMPKDLFAAFRSTFEEARSADLLLEVVDASDPESDEHLETTEQVLADLELADRPRLRIYNKVDRLSDEERRALEERSDGLALSALSRASLKELLARISELLASERRTSSRLVAGQIALEEPAE